MPKPPPPRLHDLALAAGVVRHWRDVDGQDQVVSDDALIAVLAALGHPAQSTRQIRSSLAAIIERLHGLPPLLVTEMGLPTALPVQANSAEVTGEDGVTLRLAITHGMLAPITQPGYYDLALGGEITRLAVAPPRCPLPARRGWGASLQISALRGRTASAFGGLAELADAAQRLGRAGCDALAINPVHALFPGQGQDYSPYSPSSRTFLNTALGDPGLLGLPGWPAAEDADLIDWPTALPDRLADLRACFAGLDPNARAQFTAAGPADDPALYRHATFDALYCYFRRQGAADWRDWPLRYRRSDSATVARFRAQHADEIAFHLFAQWLAREGLADAQRQATEAGMAIGLISDLAVGVHPGGSDCWAMPEAMLQGLTIGAPPDPLGPLGQNWSISGFSPQGLHQSGYQPWIAMIRAALQSSGGLRIDHAFGLARLWVIPEGGDSSQGSYLSYPFLDLVRLAALEAHRASTLIIAEDLGTAPPGFTQAVSSRNMMGMRVLWFERAADHGFIGAQDYPHGSVAMTGTHDTPTVAGWWSGRDLDWADQLGRLPSATNRTTADAIRDWDRGLLWSTLKADSARPAPDDPQPVVSAAIEHVARSSAVLAVVPVEDLLGQVEQPNLPGTIAEHPNWRRRLPAPMAQLLQNDLVAGRVQSLSRRKQG